ncbi:hypothetical protein [Mycolicibacterium sp.]|uniref:hypothetical protein n=1 Tax=Mycolicibacterium sp. TaxID=2320850 RepID=UPI003D128207
MAAASAALACVAVIPAGVAGAQPDDEENADQSAVELVEELRSKGSNVEVRADQEAPLEECDVANVTEVAESNTVIVDVTCTPGYQG